MAQLVGYIGEHSAYHHGETSLQGTIINMAQDFVGSNNINLLVPQGQFGTRIQGGSDHASARYIYTRLAPLTRLIFSPFDDPILSYLNEDGQKIEPQYYVPIIPMLLVNGASGIGTGWSTDVPNYSPLEIIENLRRYIRNKKMKHMKPWYRGFKGKITHQSKGTYSSWGKYWENDKTLEITELPLRKWTQDYKEFLQGMLPGGEGKTKVKIEDFKEYHTERSAHFSIKINDEELKRIKSKEGGGSVEQAFKLSSSISETNMVLFDSEGKIQKYKTPVHIMEEFATTRMKYYKIRKEYLIHKLTLERDLLNNRARFIKMIIEKKLKINNRKKDEVVRDLQRLKFQKFGDTKAPRSGFEYLLIMQIASLTKERYEELKRMAREKAAELEKVKKTSHQQMWLHDLDALEAGIKALYEKDAEEDPKAKGKKGKAFKISKLAMKKGKKGKKRGNDDEEEAEAAGGNEGDEQGAPVADPLDNPFGDIAKWTSVSFKVPGGEPSKKKRRTK